MGTRTLVKIGGDGTPLGGCVSSFRENSRILALLSEQRCHGVQDYLHAQQAHLQVRIFCVTANLCHSVNGVPLPLPELGES